MKVVGRSEASLSLPKGGAAMKHTWCTGIELCQTHSPKTPAGRVFNKPFPQGRAQGRLCLAVGGRAGAARAPTVGGEQEIGGVLLGQPSDLIDLLLDLQALQVIELRLVALEGAVDIVLSPAVGLVLALQGTGSS